MPDLRERFRTLDKRPAPSLWYDIERRVESSVAAVPVTRVARQRPATGRLLLLVALMALTAAAVSGAIIAGASLLPRPSVSVVPGPGVFTPTGPLNQARWGHTATLLQDGRVLILGGARGHGPRMDPTAIGAELYDPGSGAFTLIDTPGEVRMLGHTAILLADGRVLVLGATSRSDTEPQPPAMAWDPDTLGFAPVGSLIEVRSNHVAITLPDDRVLIVGGRGEFVDALATAEIRDADGVFHEAGALSVPRYSYMAAATRDGRVLVAGGYPALGGAPVHSVKIWDPETLAFRDAAPLREPRASATTTLLNDGRILLAGGNGASGALATTEVWDPVTETSTPSGSMDVGRWSHTATLLPDGRVLIAGGMGQDSYLPSAELWDPVTGSFSPAASLSEGREEATATLLQDGRVLIVGGDKGPRVEQTLASAELFDPAGMPTP